MDLAITGTYTGKKCLPQYKVMPLYIKIRYLLQSRMNRFLFCRKIWKVRRVFINLSEVGHKVLVEFRTSFGFWPSRHLNPHKPDSWLDESYKITRWPMIPVMVDRKTFFLSRRRAGAPWPVVLSHLSNLLGSARIPASVTNVFPQRQKESYVNKTVNRVKGFSRRLFQIMIREEDFVLAPLNL